MIGTVALIAYGLWIVWVFRHDRRVRNLDSGGIWLVLVWVVIHATRPVSLWFNASGGSISRDEGSPVNAAIDLSLIVAVLVLLAHRRLRWSQVIKENSWLFVFYLFWALSISWSDDSFITFKRVFRDFGSVLMVLVVLTEREPGDAIKAVCVRMAYMCVPLSIVLWKYFPGVGRSFTGYDKSVQMVVGMTLHKNSLGMLVMIAALFLLWDLISRSRNISSADEKQRVAANILTLLMSWYLLLVVNSATSFICALLGSVLLIVLLSPSFPSFRRRLEVYVLVGLAVVGILSVLVDVKGAFFQTLQRSDNLTTRTEMWPVLIEHQTDVLIGPGFNMFWSEERLRRSPLPEEYGHFVQAHNGYLETYLNGGVIGTTLLVIVLLSSYWRLRKRLPTGSSELCMKMVIIIVVVIHNWTEASFNKLGLLWFITLFGVMVYSRTRAKKSRASVYRNTAREMVPV